LNLAAVNDGLISVAEIGMKTNLSLQKAELIMGNLNKKGFVEIKIADNGAVLYHFPGIMSVADKKSAQYPRS
jgi:DNA-binding IscR family transcriptional regulator